MLDELNARDIIAPSIKKTGTLSRDSNDVVHRAENNTKNVSFTNTSLHPKKYFINGLWELGWVTEFPRKNSFTVTPARTPRPFFAFSITPVLR